jgi:hypothetical protein
MNSSFAYYFLFTGLIFTHSCGPSLCETGIPTTAFVTGKHISGKGEYTLEIVYMTQPKLEYPDSLMETYDDEGNLQVLIGDYYNGEVVVDKWEYDEAYVNYSFPLNYEKGNPTHIEACEYSSIM